MIRIIFDNGELIDCDHIEKVYVEQYEMDKVIIVGRMEDEKDDIRKDVQGITRAEREDKAETPDDRRID